MFPGRDIRLTLKLILPQEEAEELADLKVSNAMRLASKNKNDVFNSWLPLQDEYPQLIKKAFVMLILFATTYLCEPGFSVLAIIKHKIEIVWTYAVIFILVCSRWSRT